MARPKPEIVNFGGFRKITQINGSSSEDYAIVNNARANYYRTWTGSVTPGFRNLTPRQQAKLQTLAHTVSIWKTIAWPCYELKHYTTSAGTYIGAVRTDWDSQRSKELLNVGTLSSEDRASFKARAQLASKVRDYGVNLAQAFAERRMTASLVASSMMRLLTAARALRRADLRAFNYALSIDASARWKRVRRTKPDLRLANHWLEFQYGWKPLLSDVYDSCELLSKHIREDRYHEMARGSAIARWTTYTRTADGDQVTQFRVEHSQRVTFGATFRLDNASRTALAATGITNPVLLAWELLPFSFVVDWFIPVGNYLEALDAFSGFTFVDGYQMTHRTVQSTCERHGSTAKTWQYPYYTNVEFHGFVAHTERSVNRLRLTTWPGVAAPRFRNPLGGSPLSRVATAAALLRQVFSGRSTTVR